MAYSDVTRDSTGYARGLYRPQGYAASEEVNKFLKTVLMPWLGAITPVPDDNIRGTILKTTRASTTFTSTASNQYLLVIPFASPRRTIRVYAWSNLDQRYLFLLEIEQDEDISQSFKLERLVSAGIRVKSSTLSGSNFTVSGNINAITYYDLPNIAQITHEKVISYKRDNAGAVASVPASDGVTALAVPDSDHLFDVPRVPNLTFNKKQLYALRKDMTPMAAPSVPGATTLVFADLPAGQGGGQGYVIPPNAWGSMKGVGFVQLLVNNPGAVQGVLSVRTVFSFAKADPVTFNRVITAEADGQDVPIPGGTATSLRIPFSTRRYDNPAVLEQVEVQITGTGANLTYQLTAGNIEIEYDDIERDNIQGPGSMISIKSLNTGQQISVDGVFNYEVVPDANLARNVPSGFPEAKEYTDLEVAHTILANAAELGIRFVLPCPEYDSMVMANAVDQLSGRDAAIGRAASLGSYAAKLWQIMKPAVRVAGSAGLNALGPALTPYLGPTAMGLSRLAAQGFNSALASDTNTGYAADVASPVPLKVRRLCGATQEPEDQGPSPPAPNGGGDGAEVPTPVGVAAFLERHLHEGPVSGVAHAASVALPSLGEILARKAKPAAAPAPAVMSLDTHALPSAFQFDRESSPLTPLILDYARTGDAAGIKAHFVKLGCIGHRARCVLTVKGPESAPRALRPFDLYVTDRPVRRADTSAPPPRYRSVPVGAASIFVDELLQTAPISVDWMLSMPVLLALMQAANAKAYITLSRTDGLENVVGSSWHMAMYAACHLMPYGVIFSGSFDSAAADLSAKAGAGLVLTPNRTVVVLNPDKESLAAAQQELNSYGMALRIEFPLSAMAGAPAMFASTSLGACLSYAFVGLASFTSPVAQEAKQERIAQQTANVTKYNPNALESKHTVQIGSARTEKDFKDFDVAAYAALPKAMEAFEKASQGKGAQHLIEKWKQIMRANPVNYAAIAGRYANVESLRESMLTSGTPGVVRPAGEGNPANRKKREKEKAKKKLLSAGLPAPAPAAVVIPGGDITMSGGVKRPASSAFTGL